MIIVISYGNNKLLFRNSKYFDFNKRITLYVSTVNPLHKSSSDDFRVLTFIECN